MYWDSVSVDQKLSLEVPRNNTRKSVEQEAKHWVRVITTYVYLAEEGELNSKALVRPLTNLHFAPGLLTKILVTRKRKNLKVASSKLAKHGHHFLVALPGKGSFARHIDDKQCFTGKLGQFSFAAVNVDCGYIMERTHQWSIL